MYEYATGERRNRACMFIYVQYSILSASCAGHTRAKLPHAAMSKRN